LSTNHGQRRIDNHVLKLARALAEQKYGTEGWLLKR
jgi:hypothetical protein